MHNGRPMGRGILALILVAVLSGTALGAYAMYFRQTPRQLFFAAQGQYWSQALADLKEGQETALTLMQRQAREPSRTRGRLQLDFTVPDMTPDVQMARELLQAGALVVEGQNDPKADSYQMEMALELEGREILGAELLQIGDQVALKVPALYDRYLMVENGKIDDFFARLGAPDTMPDRLLTYRDYQEAMSLTADELTGIARRYGRYLYDSIGEDEVTLEEGVTYEALTGTVTVRRLTLHLSEERIKEVLAGLLAQFRQDEEALELLAVNAADLAELMLESGGDAEMKRQLSPWTDAEEAQRRLQEGAGAWEEGVAGLSFPDGLEVEVLLGPRDQVVQQTVRFSLAQDGEPVAFTLTHQRWQYEDAARDQHLQVRVAPAEGAEELELLLTAESHVDAPGAQRQGTGTYALRAVEQGQELMSLKIEVDQTTTQKADSQEAIATIFAFTMDGVEMAGKPLQAHGRIEQLVTDKLDAGRFAREYEVDLTLAEGGADLVTFSVAGDESVDFTGEVSFPELNEETAFDLMAASDQELAALGQEMQVALEMFIMGHLDLFGPSLMSQSF